MLALETALWHQGYHRVAGIDEAGRGALAGPVVAAAVVFPEGTIVPGVVDSKKLSRTRRAVLFEIIRESAVSVGVGVRPPARIDAINILRASLEAMYEAAAALVPPPDYVLIDGIHAFRDSPWPIDTIKQGDARCQAIAAASIIAKVTRDRIMQQLHVRHPAYGWDANAGYPTRAHYVALAVSGPTAHHRRSFRLRSQ